MRLKVQVTIDIHTEILDHSRIGYNSTAETVPGISPRHHNAGIRPSAIP